MPIGREENSIVDPEEGNLLPENAEIQRKNYQFPLKTLKTLYEVEEILKSDASSHTYLVSIFFLQLKRRYLILHLLGLRLKPSKLIFQAMPVDITQGSSWIHLLVKNWQLNSHSVAAVLKG